jgi:hypothetical protein
MAHCEVPQKSDRPKTPTAIHSPFGLKYQPLQKATTIPNYLVNQFTPRDLCDELNKWRIKARVRALLETADDISLEKVRPCDTQKLINSLKLIRDCGFGGIPN